MKKFDWWGPVSCIFFAGWFAYLWALGIEWPAIFALVLGVIAIRDDQQKKPLPEPEV